MLHSVSVIILSILTVACAINVIVQKNPIVSALFLIGSFFTLAGLYLSLQAPFIAAIQILIYAGAITVLFIFVIMLLNLKKETLSAMNGRNFLVPKLISLVLFVVLVTSFIQLTAFPVAAPNMNQVISVKEVALRLFSEYLFPFELASYLLLLAMVGGVIMAKRKSIG